MQGVFDPDRYHRPGAEHLPSVFKPRFIAVSGFVALADANPDPGEQLPGRMGLTETLLRDVLLNWVLTVDKGRCGVIARIGVGVTELHRALNIEVIEHVVETVREPADPQHEPR